MDHDDIIRRRRERAARWVSHDLRGYFALPIAEATEETLSNEPPSKEEKRKKSREL